MVDWLLHASAGWIRAGTPNGRSKQRTPRTGEDHAQSLLRSWSLRLHAFERDGGEMLRCEAENRCMA